MPFVPENPSLIDYFSFAFANLHRDRKKGGAPHKPILLLAILHEYKQGRIQDNRIFITPELTHSFSVYWNKLVTSEHDQKFALPFFHLTGEKGSWWRLIPNVGCELWIENAGSMRSFGNLSTAVCYAEIDQNLAFLLLNNDSRDILKGVLLKTYFPKNHLENPSGLYDSYIHDLKNEMKEMPGSYKAKLLNLKAHLNPETYQVEIYNRGAIFRREIVKLYDETCCISGIRVSAPFAITMVDACHIIPFSHSFDNSLINGIALCPNLHRAFDRGLIAVDDNYEVILSESFKENTASEYSFSKIEGKTILLPLDKDFFPSIEALAWHRSNTFRK
ncbi:HNH endonuclease [Rhabdobacter roseus]|uniref:Putative restriction endonuclease n=1 Tax=Rhabdobacter roseus TaxID=1655419 RepID=A0A840U0V8_9BACT|nr:HNH endonuclease [Rhabdobacter roseus]MBB5287532.1 putative restriction endonuclease [Rhabdobacter roseus]